MDGEFKLSLEYVHVQICDNCRSYCLHARALNSIQYATILHGRDATVTTLLRHEYFSKIRRGFDSLYFRAFRKSYAPGNNAAKRAKLNYSIEFVM